jgi:hypothetical protein
MCIWVSNISTDYELMTKGSELGILVEQKIFILPCCLE